MSASAPTLPSGYTYFLRVTEFYCGGLSAGLPLFALFKQFQDCVQYLNTVGTGGYPTLAVSTTAGGGGSTAVTATAVMDLSAFMPPDAYVACILMHCNQGGTAICVAPNINYAATGTSANPPFGITSYSTSGGSLEVDLILEPISGYSRAIYWGTSHTANSLHMLGYKRMF